MFVIVEDTGKGNYCVGCVINKTKEDAFVLTDVKMVQQGLVVHFSEEPPKLAKWLASGDTCKVVTWKDPVAESDQVVTWKDPVAESDVLIFVFQTHHQLLRM